MNFADSLEHGCGVDSAAGWGGGVQAAGVSWASLSAVPERVLLLAFGEDH